MSARKLIEAILSQDAVTAKKLVEENLSEIVADKLEEMKKMVAVRYGIEEYVDLMEEQGLKGVCWKGYEAIGMKMKDGRKVPNCVPVKEEELEEESIDEANVQKMGRAKLIRIRIRGGKVQRRKKVSAVKGYTFRGGKLVRMSASERMRRRRGARRAKIKRRGKMSRILMKRRRSMRRRTSMGLH